MKRGRGLRQHEVRRRVILARRLHKEGYSAPAIAEMLGVHHTTVYAYLGRLKKVLKATKEVEEMEKSYRCPLCGSPAMVTLIQVRDFLRAALGKDGASPPT